ncbi:unnamed protein product [Blepharisma stoltei]|uniref:Uncharacterized protein n=1 Tax=Blepharisma stoltei TaxID=1481888 RepID=A0AAU9K083_9CILI|nr:unnamed protein product [Blepharisma stoltei]
MENFSSKKVDATLEEDKFNVFYKDFYEVKLKPYIKKVKYNNFNCSVSCINDKEVNQECLANCGVKEKNFFQHIEDLLLPRIAHYEKCFDACEGKEDNAKCVEKCCSETLELLKQIDVHKEMGQFIN